MRCGELCERGNEWRCGRPVFFEEMKPAAEARSVPRYALSGEANVKVRGKRDKTSRTNQQQQPEYDANKRAAA